MRASTGVRTVRSYAFGATLLVLPCAQALAYPLVDFGTTLNPPPGTELQAADVQDLQHQLQLANGPLVAPAGGWAFQPRLDTQFLLTDNIFQVHAPRQWDFVTYLAPGFTAAADKSRLQLYFTFQPTLAMHVEAGSLNSLTQQYSGIATATLVEDLLYLDVRAISGVTSVYGGLGGIGGVGAGAVANTTAASYTGTGTTLGLNKDNELQTSSLSISPYLMRRLGSYGNIRLGYSLGLSHTETINGFVASPLPTGGNNQETFLSNEEYFHYDTGDLFSALQYSFDIDLTQGQTTTGSNFYQIATGLPQVGPTRYSSRNYYVTNRVSYQVNDTVQVFATGGWEYINYTNQTYLPINGPTWSVGTTLTPGPDTSLTASYGFNNGYYSANVYGYYGLTARTSLNAAYYSSVGTQLQYLQNQLGLARGPNLVNGNNGGQLFVGTNLLGPQQGIYRFDTFSFGAQTALPRDILSANVYLTRSSQQGANAAPSTTGTSFSVQWMHELREDLTLITAASYNTTNQSSTLTAINPGNSHAYIVSAALQYQISPTLAATLRYSFFDRISEVSSFSIYQNILVLGVSKTF